MADRDILLAKAGALDRYLSRIDEVRAREGLDPLDRQELIELNLQRAVQATIDLAVHVVAAEGWGLVDQMGVAFERLRDHGVISPDQAVLMRRMVGFRNIAVHEYDRVDPAVIERIVEHHLDDLRALAAAVLDHEGLR